MNALTVALQVLTVALSIGMICLVLLHKAKGGGVSDMFGGGMTSSLNSTGVAGRNLFRLTAGFAVTWALTISALGVLVRYPA